MQQTLAEDLVLLAYHDEHGTVVRPARTDVLPFAYAASLIMDLALLEKISDSSGLLVISDPGSTNDPLLDSILERMANSKEHLSTVDWISRLVRYIPDLEAQILERLVAKGIVRREEKKFLWVFSKTHHPTQDGSREQDVRDVIRATLLDGASPDPRIAALISLVYTTNLIPEIFSEVKDEATARDRAKTISDGLPHPKAIRGALAIANVALGRALAATGGRPLLDEPISGPPPQ